MSFNLNLNWPLMDIFVFSNNHDNFYNKYFEKCPASIWCQDLNIQPSEHESTPITTRPGLPLNELQFFLY